MPDDPREVFYHERLRHSGSRYPNFQLLSTQVTLDLIYTCELLLQTAARYMAAFGLSKSSLNILMILRHAGSEGMQLHELGELLLVSRANITGLVDHLEEKGYVKRVVDSNDRRARYAHITKKADALLDEFLPVHYDNINLLLRELAESDKQTLIHLLEKTRASVRAHAPQIAEFASSARSGAQE